LASLFAPLMFAGLYSHSPPLTMVKSMYKRQGNMGRLQKQIDEKMQKFFPTCSKVTLLIAPA